MNVEEQLHIIAKVYGGTVKMLDVPVGFYVTLEIPSKWLLIYGHGKSYDIAVNNLYVKLESIIRKQMYENKRDGQNH